MIKLIGLCGAARSGKDTAADYLKEEIEFETYAFAKPLKDMVDSLFSWGNEHREGKLKETVNDYWIENWDEKIISLCRDYFLYFVDDWSDIQLETRFYLNVILPFVISENSNNKTAILRCSPRQIYQKFGTEFARGFDNNIWIELAKLKLEKSNGLIITDVRFDNEAKFIAENLGIMVKITRPNVISVNSHVSESGVNQDYINITITNDSDLDELKNKCKKLKETYGL